MKMKKLSITISTVIVMLLAAGVVGALSKRSPSEPPSISAAVASGISYQGHLTSAGGAPLNGSYTMRFIIYDADIAGAALWDSGNLNINVDNGLFTVELGVDQASFDGQALWLSIIVNGQTLSPRQEILPAPYALSLRPGADIVGAPAAWTESILDVELTGSWPASRAGGFHAPSTGTAVYADASGGIGVLGDSENSTGVVGSSNNGWGGYFYSEGGYGIRVYTTGTAHYDHGAYITAKSGYGVYAQSLENQGVRGEAGNVAGIMQPLGTVGVVGIGQSRGVFGSSSSGTGMYGTSINNYGVWGQSSSYRGVTGRTSRPDNNYGLYTPDNLYSLNINLAGAVMQVMQNGGSEPLSPGDVVIFSGITHSTAAVDGPVVQVSKAHQAGSTAVAGVVFSRFNIEAVDPKWESADDPSPGKGTDAEVTPAGNAPPGEYILVVVQGPAQVKAASLGGSIQPGDLLSASSTAGAAARASMVTIGGMETALPGTVFGKALEPYDGTQEMIYVYVTLQ